MEIILLTGTNSVSLAMASKVLFSTLKRANFITSLVSKILFPNKIALITLGLTSDVMKENFAYKRSDEISSLQCTK